MRQIFEHIKSNWIKYGFETTAIIIGILGAHYLSNWKDSRVEKKTEAEYLSKLVVDLRDQAENILSQIALETATRKYVLQRSSHARTQLELKRNYFCRKYSIT